MKTKFSSLREFLDGFPSEVVLRIFEYLDLPDLAALSKVSPRLAGIASDPALHKNRLKIVAPSRVKHSLFNVQGLRPTIPDLVRRGVVRGLGIERRWRDGLYLYTQTSITWYEKSIKLSRGRAGHVVSMVLRDRLGSRSSPSSRSLPILPNRSVPGVDVEFSSTRISRLLLPVMHQLKWSFQRDRLAKMIREREIDLAKWIDGNLRKGIVKEGERVRLALCPGVRRKVGFYESLQLRSAVRGGADRLELCSNLGLGGGTTPSIGLLKSVQRNVDVPIMAMIRPRTGDFVYTEHEMDVMLQDIAIFKNAGVQGLVFGLLTADGKVHCERTRRGQLATSGAFDMVTDPYQAFQDVASIGGITRILTSGQKSSVVEALDVLKKLVNTSRDANSMEKDKAPAILPGSGINARTAERVVRELAPSEVHLSGGGWIEGEMLFRREGMGMGVSGDNDWRIWRTSETAVREIRSIVDKIQL
ncbi:hypothetical protein V5O48_009032 [Marasmius crinis-equi]|uniref:Copper homeostasis protein cutC homolog n=1 Tax=Marasmius crinis-equi TaxID=585013 RepID=A0ABR3FCI9_9AGAR